MKKSLLLMGVIMLLAGCMPSSPDPNYYTLSAEDGAQLHGRKFTIKVQRPTVDVTIDRPQMISMDSQYRITYDNTALWSEPVDKMVERVLAQDLEKRLPGSVAVTESGAMITNPDYVVDLDIRQFGIGADGHAVLQAVLLVHSQKSNGTPQPVMLTGGKASSGGTEAQALSELLARLADKIAEKIK